VITFTIPGDPVPQPRPRVSTQGGFARAYVPASHAIHAYRAEVQLRAKAAGVVASTDPLSVEIVATFARPTSHLTKKGVRATAPTLPRPDVDNIAKGILDALGELWGNDSCVASLSVEKEFGLEGCTSVTIDAL
jgi:Holliday junction resolvase RusA-like endonuclease